MAYSVGHFARTAKDHDGALKRTRDEEEFGRGRLVKIVVPRNRRCLFWVAVSWN